MDTAASLRRLMAIPLFDGFPYLVTRISGSLHHLIVLPRERSEPELVQLTRRQYAANRIRTTLVLAPHRALYLSESEEAWNEFVPRATDPICDRLLPAEDFRPSPDLLERQRRLREFVAGRGSSGYLVCVPTGRLATAEDREWLAGFNATGVPSGLERCDRCGDWRGEALEGALVVDVCCACENHNLCARCLRPLCELRLEAYGYSEPERELVYAPAFMGLSHKCEIGPPLRSAAH